tara:strand:- start:242 stop:850 length:609 start_codon:yes stop_codon:yes gene_type:complete
MTAKIKLNSASGGGSFSLQAPSSSSNNRVMTLPDTADGTILTTTNPKTGNIIQVLEDARIDASSHSVASGATFEPTFLRQSITTTGSNKVLVEGFITIGMTGAGNAIMLGLRRDGSNTGHGVASGNKRTCTTSSFSKDSYNTASIPFSFLDNPSAGTHEYHLQISHSSGGTQTMYINRTPDDTNTNLYPRAISVIRCKEVAV